MPGWVFVVVPMLVVGLIVGAVAVAARDGQDGEGAARIDGPAAELPAVVEAGMMWREVAVDPETSDPAGQLGERVGAVALGLVDISDESDFAATFGRLPPAAAKQLGQALGAIQRELSPSSVGGPRGSDDRRDDTEFALPLVWSAAVTLDPAATPEQQALNVLPAAVPLADGGDEIVAAVVAGDWATAAELLEPVLSEAGAAEIISGLAGDISDRLGDRNDSERLDEFQTAYRREIP